MKISKLLAGVLPRKGVCIMRRLEPVEAPEPWKVQGHTRERAVGPTSLSRLGSGPPGASAQHATGV